MDLDQLPQILGYVAAISLQILILHAMRNGAWRKFPFVFLYVVVDLITNLVEIKPNLTADTMTAAAKHNWFMLYWWNERVIQATLLLLVISLIYRASAHLRSRRALMAILICGSVLYALVSLALHYDPEVTTGKWMTRWSRDMNFCIAILDLMLWATLIRIREKDQRILMISGALGLQFTAGAIGQGLRDLSHNLTTMAAVMIVGANLACLYIWWSAFRVKVRAGKAHLVHS